MKSTFSLDTLLFWLKTCCNLWSYPWLMLWLLTLWLRFTEYFVQCAGGVCGVWWYSVPRGGGHLFREVLQWVWARGTSGASSCFVQHGESSRHVTPPTVMKTECIKGIRLVSKPAAHIFMWLLTINWRLTVDSVSPPGCHVRGHKWSLQNPLSHSRGQQRL